MEKTRKFPWKTMVVVLLIAAAAMGIYLWQRVPAPENVRYETVQGQDYPVLTGDYAGDYDLQYLWLSDYYDTGLPAPYNCQTVMTWEEYAAFCSQWGLEQTYSDQGKRYIVVAYAADGFPSLNARVANVEYDGSTARVYLWDRAEGGSADIRAYMLTIPTEPAVSNVQVVSLYTEDEVNNLRSHGSIQDLAEMDISYKPIIYLYPSVTTDATVSLGRPEKLLCSYPLYDSDGWQVLAQPNGDLTDLETGRELYALYYESANVVEFTRTNVGFVVARDDTIPFLEEKLAVLGLNEHEAEEFIVYWLPRLLENEYNYIRFATSEEIEANMSLQITPEPDSTIRVLMVWQGLTEPVTVQEQRLTTPVRTGFTAVEWGGTELN